MPTAKLASLALRIYDALSHLNRVRLPARIGYGYPSVEDECLASIAVAMNHYIDEGEDRK